MHQLQDGVREIEAGLGAWQTVKPKYTSKRGSRSQQNHSSQTTSRGTHRETQAVAHLKNDNSKGWSFRNSSSTQEKGINLNSRKQTSEHTPKPPIQSHKSKIVPRTLDRFVEKDHARDLDYEQHPDTVTSGEDDSDDEDGEDILDQSLESIPLSQVFMCPMPNCLNVAHPISPKSTRTPTSPVKTTPQTNDIFTFASISNPNTSSSIPVDIASLLNAACEENPLNHDPDSTTNLPPSVTTNAKLALDHLREAHALMIHNPNHIIIFFNQYVGRIAAEIATGNLQSVAKLTEQTNHNGQHIYVLGNESCGKDLEIRRELQSEKLNEMLQIQEMERRSESQKPRKCLFCRVVGQNRQSLFEHMFHEHGFNIGLPDNLVQIDEFLDLLQQKLANLVCLYCEKLFKNAPTLRKHMRKKKHFKVNPRQRAYDRYYIVNYLEPGKTWEEIQMEDDDDDEDDNLDVDEDVDEDEIDDESGEDVGGGAVREATDTLKMRGKRRWRPSASRIKSQDDWTDWNESSSEPTMCLFDERILPSAAEACEHMKQEHGFDLATIRREMALDFYQTLKLINYIRRETSMLRCYSCHAGAFETMEQLEEHMQGEGHFANVPQIGKANFWDDPQYLFPTYENDPLLFDVDFFEGDADEDEDEKGM
ncbi:hypothetical protein HK102_008662 [Quaeritorhiza haematococci]|nr:hypothetical protein HK102_008662 [Quaeritorhiza haematococci]